MKTQSIDLLRATYHLTHRLVHPAVDLWSRHQPAAGYPKGVVPVPRPIVGTAFFPGGYGIWNAERASPPPRFPIGETMVLGHDFHSEAGYSASASRGFESPTQPTWRNLVAILRDAQIDPGTCFFTNVFMGLRQGSATTGEFPGARDDAFVAHCQSFLREQLSMQRPALIIIMGLPAARFLGRLSPSISQWTDARSFADIDASGPVQIDVDFPGVPGVRAAVVAISHPSLRSANVGRRRFGSAVGAEAEREMLRAAMVPRRVRVEE